MNRQRISGIVFTLIILSSMLLASCRAQTTPTTLPPTTAPAAATPQPVATQPPKPTATTKPSEPKVVTLSFTTGDPESLNPIYASTWIAEVVFDLIYLPLWNIDNDMKYQMELAEELPTLQNGGVSPDGMTITIKFRKEAVWSDGTSVTAQDAVFTYDMIMSDKNSVASRYPFDTYVNGMTAVDDHTLKIEMSQPYVDWSTSIFTGISRILPKHILEPIFQKDGSLDNAAYNRLPNITNGSFLITEFQPSSHLSFAANDKYWRGRPKLDKLFFRLVEDRAAQLAALASSQSDIGSYIIGSELEQIKKIGNLEIQTSDNGYQVLMFLNIDPKTAHPAMTDPTVRRAIALAIDRQLIIDKIYNGLYKIPATYWYGTVYDNPDLKAYPFDPELAKALLEKAGWVDKNGDGVREKDGQDLMLRYVYISGDQAGDTMVTTIQQMLADVGIKVEIFQNTREVLWASFTDNGPLAIGEFDLTHWSDGMWYYPAPDTSYFLCSERPTIDYPSGYNWFGVCLPELEDLFQKQAVEIDPQKRIDLYHQIGKLMYDQTLIIPLHNDPDVWAINTRLKDIKFSGVDPLMFAYAWDIK